MNQSICSLFLYNFIANVTQHIYSKWKVIGVYVCVLCRRYTERSGKTSGVVAQTYKEENIIIQKNRTVLKTHFHLG